MYGPRQTDGTESVNWPLVAQKLRGMLSQHDVLKIAPWRNMAVMAGAKGHATVVPSLLAKLVIAPIAMVYGR